MGITAAAAWLLATASAGLLAQPYPATDWPPTINPNATVSYGVFDPDVFFASTPGGWLNDMTLAGGGDQAFSLVTLDAMKGDQGTSAFLNLAVGSGDYANFASTPQLDVLLQVFGDDSLFNPDGTGKEIIFREGILGTELPVSAGSIPAGATPPGANNGHWNWMLFTITNPVSPHPGNTSGLRYLGFQASTVPVGAQNGGVNGGTLRIEGLPGLSLRAVAIGPVGAFGSSNSINTFLPPAACDPEPGVNLAFIDIAAGSTNHLIVLDDGDQTVVYQNGVGPTGDLRRAVQATSGYMNFGITDHYLGAACNPNRAMKVCVEFYDDPALTGVSFGPEDYAVDTLGGVGTYAGPRYTLTGTGRWLKLAFWVPGVNLTGINTAPYTGGPRLTFTGGFPFIDRAELGIARAGSHPLAGLDPDPEYRLDPLVCVTNWGYYAELDLQRQITNRVSVGTSGGDQNMVVELAGPAGDQRLSVRPDAGNNNIQFALLDQAFGPTYQDNSRVVSVLTYYDDPALAGATLRAQVYRSLVNGTSSYKFPSERVTLQGTGLWRDAVFDIPDVNFEGVNQGPQSVARFQTEPAVPGDPTSGYVHVSRVRFNVVRPCGEYQGIHLFQNLGISRATTNVEVTWFGQATLQSAPAITATAMWSDLLNLTNALTNTYATLPTNSSGFFRLRFPPLPAPPVP